LNYLRKEKQEDRQERRKGKVESTQAQEKWKRPTWFRYIFHALGQGGGACCFI